MRAVPLALVACIAFVAAQDSPPVPAPADITSDRAIFAVLRRDGLIAPFALLRGRRWTAPWPAGLRVGELPLNLDAVPDSWWGGRAPGAEWKAWLSDGRVQTITLRAPAPYLVHCSRRMGIRTDYQAEQPPPPMPVEPFPKDGIAISDKGMRLQPVESVPREGDGWALLALSLLDDFDRAEDQSVGTIAYSSGWRHPVRREDRQRVGVRLESWYRTPLANGDTVSYIEAVRSYEPGPEDEGCGLETFFSGWVFHPAGAAQPRTILRARVTYCDRVGATYMLPFGVLRVEGRVHWIYQLSGWEDEWYVVTETGARTARHVAEYYAGRACR